MAPRPLLLVPGWSDRARSLRRCRDYFVESGWPDSHVHCLEFSDRFGSNVEHAREVASAVSELRSATGADRVSVVAHSMGGLAVRYYLGREEACPVDAAVFVGTPHHGTWAAWVAWGGGAPEMRPRSAFLRQLNAQPLPSSVRAFCISTPLDTRVLPGSSAHLPNAECHVVRYPRHDTMLRHRPTLQLIRRLVAGEP